MWYRFMEFACPARVRLSAERLRTASHRIFCKVNLIKTNHIACLFREMKLIDFNQPPLYTLYSYIYLVLFFTQHRQAEMLFYVARDYVG